MIRPKTGEMFVSNIIENLKAAHLSFWLLTEGVSRTVSEDTVGSPRSAVSTSGGGGGDTRSPMGQTESITTPLRGTPSVPLDGAQIKTEVITLWLTPY